MLNKEEREEEMKNLNQPPGPLGVPLEPVSQKPY